jgi:anti-sigma regulatory factor (Ser/Thr protein kinase)
VSHNLTVYDDDDHLATRVADYLTSGIERDQATIAVVDARKWAVLSEAIGPAVSRLQHLDRDPYYTRPEAAIAGYDTRIRRLVRDGARSVRVFGELPLCVTQEQVDTWITYEAILNRAFERHPVSILCGCDAREQPDAIVEGSWRTHPHVLGQGWEDNHDYHDPAEIVRRHTRPSDSPLGLRPLDVDGDVVAFRRQLSDEMGADEVPEPEARALLIAAGELLANARRHGDGIRSVRIGRVGASFVCEISDRGPGIEDPLAGYVPPAPGGDAGGGLWVARQLTRRLDLLSTDYGLTARLWVQADRSAA